MLNYFNRKGAYIMYNLKKALPLCLFFGVSQSMAGVINPVLDSETSKINKSDYSVDEIEKISDAREDKKYNYIQLVKMQEELEKEQNLRKFINVEIHEVIVKNIQKPFSELDKSVKLAKNTIELDKTFQSFGDVQETNSFNFSNVLLNKEASLSNSYSRGYVEKNNVNNKKIDNYQSVMYSYNFKFFLWDTATDKIDFKIKGKINTEYGDDSDNKSHLKKAGMSSEFTQSSNATINEYTIISNDVKDLSFDQKALESKFLVVKFTKP